MANQRGKPYGLYAIDDPDVVSDPRSFMPQVCKNEVSALFFGADNIAALQHGIRYGVYQLSGGELVVGEQSRDELEVIMRSIYLSHAVNLPFNQLEQVRALNKKVLDYCVPRVEQEARMYLKYRVDLSSAVKPMSYGLFTSRAGLRAYSGGGV